jgi:phosphoadenosine phosphosulfate reductase
MSAAAIEVISADAGDLAEMNGALRALTAEQRTEWAFAQLPAVHILSSSFGAQAAVLLHMLTRVRASIPVVLIDTGYLFPETYQFIDSLTERLALNVKVFRSELSPSWFEARHGKLWEQGVDGIDRYNRMVKLEPMQRALRELNVGTWFSGLRREQSTTRSDVQFVELKNNVYKVQPILDWSDRDVGVYLKAHQLPYHPLWEQGYVSIGDWHTTRSLREVDNPEELRFFGLKRECGLHGIDGEGV